MSHSYRLNPLCLKFLKSLLNLMCLMSLRFRLFLMSL
jgi:hypothetical protein